MRAARPGDDQILGAERGDQIAADLPPEDFAEFAARQRLIIRHRDQNPASACVSFLASALIRSAARIAPACCLRVCSRQ